jgi:hypothetical protein
MEPDRLEHLKMIQTIIGRMAQNSFVLKGWSVTLATGLVAAGAASGKDPRLILLALLPVLVFWGLDAFYLRQERLFRALHDNVCAAFGTDPVTFSLDTRVIDAAVTSWWRTLFSKTVIWLHAPIVAVVLIVTGTLMREGILRIVIKIFS